MSRYDTQVRFAPFGPEGQAALERARVAVVGVGALGSAVAESLARAGVGSLRLIDRDVVELSNLHRQSLFDEADVARARPKAQAAAEHLAALRSDLRVEVRVEDLDGANALALLEGADLVLDGTDNFEARQVLNEAGLETARPWVHAACLGAQAVVWPLRPGRGACFACLVPEVPAPGEAPTCDAAGVLPPAVQAAAAQQTAEALKLLAGKEEALLDGPWTLDVWTGRVGRVRAERAPDCRACAGERAFLGRRRSGEVIACGRNGVQLRPGSDGPVDLESLAERLGPVDGLTRNRFLLRFAAGSEELTVFRDGRVLVAGTRDPARARAVAARWLGG